MIDLAILEDMFSGMRAKTNWNLDGPMLWGYFFMDRSAEKLERAAKILVAQGYRFVGIHEADDRSTRVLHVDRAETHSPQTLFERNEVLYKLADDLGLDSYDGMDVGPVLS
jgi:Regulator of ribonuclease activity B